MSKASKSLKIFVHSMDGVGHLNASIGMGQALANRGHHVIFVINKSSQSEIESYGLEVIPLEPPPPKPQNQEQSDKPKSANRLLTALSSLDKMKLMSQGGMFSNIEGTIAFSEQLGHAISRERPDLIVMDHVLIPPSVMQSAIPYALIYSGNPLFFYNSPKLPPTFSGYSTSSDPSTWAEYKPYINKFLQLIQDCQSQLNEAMNFKPANSNANLASMNLSPYLNIYAFPYELDYQDLVPLPNNMIQVDAFCREIPQPFELPEEFQVHPGQKLIYLSMGSMACNDVELLKRLTQLIGTTAHKCIVSKGPRADEFELPDNCWGKAHLPQTRILPLVDLVITHGGNNTVTETFSFGKPMIVLPFFADQFDNAQRIQEKGYGIRLDTYEFNDGELIDAIERLLNDGELNKRLRQAAKRIEQSNSKEKACQRVEQLAME